MKCWINGSLCPYQSGDDFGLLTVSSNICNGCVHILEHKGDLIEIVERVGIKPEPSEEDWCFLTKNTKFLLSGLGLLKKELSKKVPEINEETIRKLIDEDERVINLLRFIANQKRLLRPEESLGFPNLEDRIAMTIQEAEKELRNIEEGIRKDAEGVIDKNIEIVSELIKLIKGMRIEGIENKE